MIYWKISFESLMEIREKFADFLQRCERTNDWVFEKKRRYWFDFYNEQFDKSKYLSSSYFQEKYDKEKRELEIWREVNIEKFDKLLDSFNFFMDVIEFHKITPADYGKTIIFDFYRNTIETVKRPENASNNWYYLVRGINYTFKGTVVDSYIGGMILKFDRFVN